MGIPWRSERGALSFTGRKVIYGGRSARLLAYRLRLVDRLHGIINRLSEDYLLHLLEVVTTVDLIVSERR